MSDEQKEWSKQYTSNIGAREFLRLSCAIVTWIFLGAGVSVLFGLAGYDSLSSIVFGIFFVALFVFAFISPRRKQTYLLLRKILGNENLPAEPMPRSTVKISRKPLPLLYYVLAIWRWILGLLVLYFIIKYVFK